MKIIMVTSKINRLLLLCFVVHNSLLSMKEMNMHAITKDLLKHYLLAYESEARKNTLLKAPAKIFNKEQSNLIIKFETTIVGNQEEVEKYECDVTQPFYINAIFSLLKKNKINNNKNPLVQLDDYSCITRDIQRDHAGRGVRTCFTKLKHALFLQLLNEINSEKNK